MATEYFDPVNIQSRARRRITAEDGYVLVAVVFMLAILMLSLAVAAPRIKQALERDREVEATHRGQQYIRAIQLYYRKYHVYPPNVDALVMTENVRFLRKKYVDPITGKDDWKPILFGQNKVPTVVGFFGQPITISTIAGTGPGGAGTGGSFNSSSAGSNQNPDTGGASSNSIGNQTIGGASSDSANGQTFGGNGQTFGGAGIIGFSIPSEKRSILVYKKQVHFNQWEFVYDPMQEQIAGFGPGGGANLGLNSGTPGSIGGNAPNSFGSGVGPQPVNGPWGSNGNLPTPTPGSPGSGGTPTNGTWGPNGNLPSPSQPQPQ
jgi:type II secretory pathway pseudopilin PulG